MTRGFRAAILIACVLGWSISGISRARESIPESVPLEPAEAAPGSFADDGASPHDGATVAANMLAHIDDCARVTRGGFAIHPGAPLDEVERAAHAAVLECVGKAIEWAKVRGYADEAGVLITPSGEQIDELNRAIGELLTTSVDIVVARHARANEETARNAISTSEPELLVETSAQPRVADEPEKIGLTAILSGLAVLTLVIVSARRQHASRKRAREELDRKRRLEALENAANESLRRSGLDQSADAIESMAYELESQVGDDRMCARTNPEIARRVEEHKQSVVADLATRFPDEMDEPGRLHVMGLVERGATHRLNLSRKEGATRAANEIERRRHAELVATLENTSVLLHSELAELEGKDDTDALMDMVAELARKVCSGTGCDSVYEARKLFDGPNTIQLLDKLIELYEEFHGEDAFDDDDDDSNDEYIDEDDDAEEERHRAQEERLERIEREMGRDRRKHAAAEQDRLRNERAEHARRERDEAEAARRRAREQRELAAKQKDDEIRRASRERDAAYERKRRSQQFEVVEISTVGSERVSGMTYSRLENAIHAANRISAKPMQVAVIVRDNNGNTVWSK